MATYDWGVDRSFKAAINLSASQYRFVKAGSVTGEVTLSNVDGGSVLGVLQNKPRAAEEATVRVMGFSKVCANTEDSGSLLNYGGYVKSGSDGMAAGYVGATASMFAAGIMYDTSYTSSCGAYVEIFILPPGVRSY